MAESTQEIENQLQNAISMYQKTKNLQIAQEFDIPFQHLHSHLHGHSCQLNLHPVNRALDNSQEQALKD